MTISEKIDYLKGQVNYEHSKFVQETISPSIDMQRAVIHALRTMGKEANCYEKTIYIPLVNDQRYYPITLSNFTKEKIDFVKVKSIALLTYSDDNTTTYYGPVTGTHLPNMEYLEEEDFYRLAQRVFGSTIAFKQNLLLETVVAGIFDAIVARTGTSLTMGAAPVANQYITNLDRADQGEWYYDVATTAANPTTMTNDIEAVPYSWAVGDKLYVSTGKPMFLILTFRAIPQLDYFNSETVIPCQNQFLDDLDSLAVNYLYNILSTRDPEAAKGLMLKRQLGLNKSDKEVVRDTKRRTTSVGSTIVKSYNPLFIDTKYGR